MNTPSISNVSMNTSTSSIPRELPKVVTFRYQNQRKPVTLAASHQEAQDIAARTFPSLANVDPSWLRFSTAVRYRSTGERRVFHIPPEGWSYVTSKLVAYRCIDIHVVPPSSSPEGTPSSQVSSLYPVTPPQHDMYLDDRSQQPIGFYRSLPLRDDASPYSESPGLHTARYPDTPPPKYPGEQIPSPVATTGYGYGFSWGPAQQSVRPSPLYVQPGTFSPSYGTGMEDMSDKRSNKGGWSINSVGLASPAAHYPRSLSNPIPPSPTFPPSSRGANGLGLFSSIRQRVFPTPWPESSGRIRRRRRNSHPVKLPDSEDEEDFSEVTTRSGRSYVPSLI